MNGVAAKPSLRNAIIVGTACQLAMVIAGHWVPFIKLNLFAVGGVVISAFAGSLYARDARVPRRSAAAGGAIAGGVCAILGIVVSYALGDVPAVILAIGTISSAVGGALGGAISGGVRT